MRTLAALLSLALLPWAPSPPRAEAASVERTIVVNGVPRSYLVHVPPTWDRVRPIPLLFVFHGAGSDAESMVRATGFEALAAETHLLVVYPRAPASTLRYDVDPPAG